MLLALCTGMRRGEVLGLEWRDVDFQRRQVTLRQTKNGSRRSVPLVSPAYEVLEARRKLRRLDTPLIFPGRKNPRMPDAAIQPKDLTKPWETARQKARLADFRFHDLRHSAASYLAMSGASTLEIAAILGHKTPADDQKLLAPLDGASSVGAGAGQRRSAPPCVTIWVSSSAPWSR